MGPSTWTPSAKRSRIARDWASSIVRAFFRRLPKVLKEAGVKKGEPVVSDFFAELRSYQLRTVRPCWRWA